jgi:hypothetical protein
MPAPAAPPDVPVPEPLIPALPPVEELPLMLPVGPLPVVLMLGEPVPVDMELEPDERMPGVLPEEFTLAL